MRVYRPSAEHATARRWPVHENATGNEAMVTAPSELAGTLAGLATQPRPSGV